MAKMFYKNGQLSKTKFWELQIQNDNTEVIFDFGISWTKNCDHAGFSFKFEILSFWLDFKVYDNRHWDYDRNNYIDYDKLCPVCLGSGEIPDFESKVKYDTKECSNCDGYGIKKEFQE